MRTSLNGILAKLSRKMQHGRERERVRERERERESERRDRERHRRSVNL